VTGTFPATGVKADRVDYALRLGDDALVLSHRLAEWSSRAPQLEEDIALTNIALDLLGQARALLTYAGSLEGEDRDEDDLAYLRREDEFRSCLLVEQPTRDDFGLAMAGLLYFAAYLVPLYEQLSGSTDATFAAIAAKGLKEARYHLGHASEWTIRLGDGTAESHRRMQESLDELWRFTGELFECDDLTDRLVAVGVAADPTQIRELWNKTIDVVLAEATLQRPSGTLLKGSGRSGRHSEHLGYLLAEMQYLHRLHPGATW
jgi:ring-1,2-phenylacetyl-CoA epoxidase subunit PaaC